MYCMQCEVILISIFTLDSKKKKIVQWNDNLDENVSFRFSRKEQNLISYQVTKLCSASQFKAVGIKWQYLPHSIDTAVDQTRLTLPTKQLEKCVIKQTSSKANQARNTRHVVRVISI